MAAVRQVSVGNPLEIGIESLKRGSVRVRMATDGRGRPGGSVNGPTLFALADLSAWGVVCSIVGPQLMSVTTQCSIDFLRKPNVGQDVIATADCVKSGKSLIVSRVSIFSADPGDTDNGEESHGNSGQDAVAIATVTYSLPRSSRL